MKQLKKTFALFLVFILFLGLLPTARAAADESDGEDENGLILDKWYTPDETGVSGTLTLETYVKGTVVHTTTVVSQPLDIVLVLDMSASMDETISVASAGLYAENGPFSYNDVNGSAYYYQDSDGAYRVEAHSGNSKYWLSFEKNGTFYYLKGDQVLTDLSSAQVSRWSYSIYNGVLYESTSKPTKLAALKKAVASLVDMVYADAVANDVDHRIGIVTFSDEADTVDGLISVSSNREKLLSDTLNLEEDASTAADYGFAEAIEVMESARADSNKVVIFVTDGEPNHDSGFSGSVARATIGYSKTLKAAGAKVYSIGVYDASAGSTGGCGCGSSTDPEDIENYMHAVSSNYPNATSYTSDTMGSGSDLGYFMKAGNADQLSGMFQTITEEAISGSARLELDWDAVILDEISEYFDLPDGIEPEDIKVYYAEYLGNDTWGEKRPFTAARLELDVENKQVRVTNFDFSYYYVPEGNEVNNANNIKGRKLIIEIPIVDNGTGYGDVPTNTTDSGVYQDQEKIDSGESVDRYPVPDTYFPSFTLVHSSDGSADHIRLSSLTDGTYDLTQAVKEDHLYGGYYHYENDTVGAPYTENGMQLQPTDGAVYFLKEVPKTYLRPATLSLSSKGVKYTWMLTSIDSLDYKLAGFDVANRNLQLTTPDVAVEENSFCKTTADEMDAVSEKIYVEMVYGAMYTFDVVDVSGNDEGYIVCIRFSDLERYIDNGSFDVHPYFVTPDNIKVTGDTVRTLTYTSANLTETASGRGAKNPVSSDEADFEAYVTVQPYAPLKLMAFAPLRMVSAKPLEVVEPAPIVAPVEEDPVPVEEPAEDPVPVEEPAEEPVSVEEPAEEPAPVEEPAEEPAPVEEPAEEPAPVEEPAEEPVEINPSDASDYEAPEPIGTPEPAAEPTEGPRPLEEPVKAEEPVRIEEPIEIEELDETEEPAEEPIAAPEPAEEPAEVLETAETDIVPPVETASLLVRILTAVSTFLARLFGFVK